MKRLNLILIMLLMTTSVYAKNITVTITQEQYDAMSVMTSTPEEWVQNAVTNKANSMIDRLVEKYSDKQADKMTNAEKKAVIDSIDLEKEKNERRGK